MEYQTLHNKYTTLKAAYAKLYDDYQKLLVINQQMREIADEVRAEMKLAQQLMRRGFDESSEDESSSSERAVERATSRPIRIDTRDSDQENEFIPQKMASINRMNSAGSESVSSDLAEREWFPSSG